MRMVVAIAPETDELLAEIEAIYRDRIGELRRVARAVLGDSEAAHDAVQDGFVRAVRDRGSYRRDAPLEGWVWGCVMNAIRDAGRDLGKRRRPLDGHDATTGSIEQGRQDTAIRAAVRRLPERQRLALFLRHYADLDYAEIGAALGIATGTVSATLHAAHAALRTALEGDER
jgi:RNA polymerase sigma-70 factor (ECF subfamily)